MRKPPLIGPSAVATPAIAAHNPMARPRSSGGNVLVMIDSVAGMMNAPPMPMNARVTINWFGVLTSALASEPTPKIVKPELQRTAPPEAVTQAARGEQQAREHERVRVDHPLELAVAGVEVAHERRDGDVQDRVVDDDDQQREAQHPEGPPALLERFARAVEREQGGDSGRGGAHGRDLTG